MKPIDHILKTFSEDKEFEVILKEACEKNNLLLDDVKKCIGGLYNRATDTYGVTIRSLNWNNNEILALGVLFKYHNIPFRYWGKEGFEEFPYEL